MNAKDYVARAGNMSISFFLGIQTLEEWSAALQSVPTKKAEAFKEITTLMKNYHSENPYAIDKRQQILNELILKLDNLLKNHPDETKEIHYDLVELRARAQFKSDYLKKLGSLDYKTQNTARYQPTDSLNKFRSIISRVIKHQQGESIFEPTKPHFKIKSKGTPLFGRRSLESHSLMEQIDPLHRPWGDKYHHPVFKNWTNEKNQNPETPAFLIWLEKELDPQAQNKKPDHSTQASNENQKEALFLLTQGYSATVPNSGYASMIPSSGYVHNVSTNDGYSEQLSILQPANLSSLSKSAPSGIMHMTIYLNTPEERAPYKLTLEKGKLQQHQGLPFDTSSFKSLQEGAGWAIAVQFPNGTFYAGQHTHQGQRENTIEVFHHSSFAGGGNINWAGLLKVNNGQLEAISNQSGHYHTDSPNGHQITNEDTLRMLKSLQENNVDLSNVRLELINVKTFSQIIRIKNQTKSEIIDIPFETKSIFNCAEFLASEGKCTAQNSTITDYDHAIVPKIKSIIQYLQASGIPLEDIEVTLNLPELFYYPDEGSAEYRGPNIMNAEDFLDDFDEAA
jgi:hypothetical protein